MNKEIKSVDEYIKKAPEWSKKTLREIRKIIKETAPKAEEKISYKMPYYSQKGKIAYFAVHKNHCSFYWISNDDKKTFKKELEKLKVVGNTLQIPKGTKVPITIIKKIVRIRIKNNYSK